MHFFYYFTIATSILGFGFFLNNNLKIYSKNIGVIGFCGIFFLILISYLSSLFFAHTFQFNSFFLILGLLFFGYFFLKKNIDKVDLIKFIFVFTILFIFILNGKNHDDFPYYHFAYTHMLTQNNHPIGIGLLNNGFRNPSSLFFLNSLFYLPKIDIYLYHIGSVFCLGFANLFFLKNIFNYEIFKKFKFYNYINLFSLIFVNIFFSRLSEYGTDRAGQILLIIVFIVILMIINNNSKNSKIQNKELISFLILIVCIAISLKPFYLIYTTLIFFLIYEEHLRKYIKVFVRSKLFILSLLFVFSSFFITFINSSCLIFPASFTCFDNLPWSISKEEVQGVKIWYELWSKGGATPNFVFEDRLNYIKNFNWVSNWIDIYFFNKMSDYLLSLLFLSFILFLVFKADIKRIKKQKKYLLVYLFLIFYFVEWLFFHPSLRYGGYHLFALLIFIPLVFYLEKNKLQFNLFKKRALILIIITTIIFLGRNVSRLHKEYKVYDYNIFKNMNYKFIDKKEDYFRYEKMLDKKEFNYEYIDIFGKKILLIKK